MPKQNSPPLSTWLDNCGGWQPRHDLGELRRGIGAGLLNAQDEYGMTALSFAVTSGWQKGVEELLGAGADTNLRYFRTGATPLHLAVIERNEQMIATLVAGGADPDAANHWGITPRTALPGPFEGVPFRTVTLPEPRIQNVEHLADHYHPKFKIPKRQERESLQAGQAVDLYVYGPKAEGRQDKVKVRITGRHGSRPSVRYVAAIETPTERMHLPAGMETVEFGPEHVATVYIPKPSKETLP